MLLPVGFPIIINYALFLEGFKYFFYDIAHVARGKKP